MGSLKELVEFIAKSIVDDPSQVHVSEIEGEASVILELRVGPEDMGRVIGKGGNAKKWAGRSLRIKPALHGGEKAESQRGLSMRSPQSVSPAYREEPGSKARCLRETKLKTRIHPAQAGL